MKKAIVYLRVSTGKQETDRQRQELLEYAKYLGYNVIAVLEDIESGLHDDRPQFMKLLSYTKNEIDAVLVWEISRIGRKTSTVIKTIEDWTNQGICFIAKKENLISLDYDGKMNANTKLFLSIMATIAENEANTIKERMRSGKIHKLRNGGEYADKTPFGYVKVNGRFQIHPTDGELVKKCFEMRAKGEPYNKIAKCVGITRHSVINVLSNICYTGIAYNKYVPEMTFTTPKLISNDLWEAVQKTFKKRSPNVIAKFAPLRMKIVCPICGRKFGYGREYKRTSTGAPFHRYYCPNQEHPHPPYSKIVNAEKLHKLIEAVIDVLPEEEIIIEEPSVLKQYIASLEQDKAKYEREAEIMRRKLSAVKDLLTNKEIENEQRKIEREMEKADNTQVEIDAANARLSNAIVLKSSPIVFKQSQPWYELVKEVRLIEFREGYKKFEVELIDGNIKYVELNSPKGWASIEDKSAMTRIAKEREAKKRLQRSQDVSQASE